MSAILPGATIGIFGGGQLGRMMAMAARPLGYRVCVVDPASDCASRPVVERAITASLEDVTAARELALASQVVTIEIEKVGLAAMREAAKHTPVRPGASVLEIVQDRVAQKRWLARHGFPMGPYREAHGPAELVTAAQELGAGCFVKAAHGGYDGRGQAEVTGASEAAQAWTELGGSSCVVEQRLPLAAELSVLVARRPSGTTVVYPPALNHHERRILAWSVFPAPLPEPTRERARELARAVAENLEIEGLLVVELFLLADDTLLVNELAPRPHNSFHATELACVTSQFEQAVRAVCDLPLGSTEVLRPAAIVNLLGDLWLGPKPADLRAAFALPGVRVHLYGKTEARPGRKMGHLAAYGATSEDAVERVLEAYRALRPDEVTQRRPRGPSGS